jgi:hypothetical protein
VPIRDTRSLVDERASLSSDDAPSRNVFVGRSAAAQITGENAFYRTADKIAKKENIKQ